MSATKNCKPNDINHKNSAEHVECKMSIEDQELSHILFLPMDNIDYAKYYDFILKKPSGRKTIQTRIYMFLEHPSGWLGLFYHVSV